MDAGVWLLRQRALWAGSGWSALDRRSGLLRHFDSCPMRCVSRPTLCAVVKVFATHRCGLAAVGQSAPCLQATRCADLVLPPLSTLDPTASDLPFPAAPRSKPNFNLPWQRMQQYTSKSTGFAVETEDGQRLLLTNAHSVSYNTQAGAGGAGCGGADGRWTDGALPPCRAPAAPRPPPTSPRRRASHPPCPAAGAAEEARRRRALLGQGAVHRHRVRPGPAHGWVGVGGVQHQPQHRRGSTDVGQMAGAAWATCVSSHLQPLCRLSPCVHLLPSPPTYGFHSPITRCAVEDDKFWEDIVPLELSELPALQVGPLGWALGGSQLRAGFGWACLMCACMM